MIRRFNQFLGSDDGTTTEQGAGVATEDSQQTALVRNQQSQAREGVTPLLSVGDDVDASRLLQSDGFIHRLVLQRFEFCIHLVKTGGPRDRMRGHAR
jgi:hypothetical protein